MIRVLIAEDQQIVRLGLKAALTKTGEFEVVAEAATGLDLIDLAKKIQPEVLIVDINLPGINGIDATKAIKKELPNSRVVMFTGYGDDNSVFGALAAGADSYVLKDSSITKLFLAIKTVVSGSCWLDGQIAPRILIASAEKYEAKAAQEKEAFDVSILSEREKEVLQLIAKGKGNQEIADTLYLSIDTVKSHVRHIMQKLGVESRTEAAIKAIKLGLAAA
jgi:DNA-binding NarL/FixJ family response regulator